MSVVLNTCCTTSRGFRIYRSWSVEDGASWSHHWLASHPHSTTTTGLHGSYSSSPPPRRSMWSSAGRRSKHSRIVACYFGVAVLPSARHHAWPRAAPMAIRRPGTCNEHGGARLACGKQQASPVTKRGRASWMHGCQLFSSK
jgi:hypothetical protein